MKGVHLARVVLLIGSSPVRNEMLKFRMGCDLIDDLRTCSSLRLQRPWTGC